MKETIVLGCDPDTNKSGLAEYSDKYGFHLFEYTLWDLFLHLKIVHKNFNVILRLEAGHKDKRTWHKGGNQMAKRVGSNNEIGRQIEKFCTAYNIELQLVAPCGLSNINHEKFCKITGWDNKIKTNPEKRVAGLLCYKKDK